MKRITLLLAAGMLAACNEIPSGPDGTDPAIEPAFIDVEPAYSPGCFDLQNNATQTWDRLYDLIEFSGTFSAGEVISVSAGYPVTDVVPGSLFFTEIVANEPFPGTLMYTIPADGVYTLAWGVNIGDATWDVICGTPTVNTAPLATNDAYTTDEDVPLVVAASAGVLANDTDANGDPLTAALVAGPSHGSVTLNADGSFTYTPDANFHGTDSFTYDANDGLADSNVATVDITVHPVNDEPVATDDAYTTDEDVPLVVTAPGVLDNDDDADGDPLTVALDAGPANGLVTPNADGSFTYTPNAGFYGSDSFTYKANDGLADSEPATVSITVNRVIDVTIVISSDKKDAPNTINTKSNGVVAVAILGDAGEFALTDIDWTTLAFGPAGATVAHDLSNALTWAAHVVDVNGDGIPDLVTHYSQKATGLASGDTEACLTGMIDGVAIAACGAVTVK